jgi:DNA polymerase (family 10)
VRILINSDAHGVSTLGITRWGVATARRAWLTKDDVANTVPWKQFAKLRKRAASAKQAR